MLAIPTDAPPCKFAGLTRIFLLEWAFDGPVMWKF